MRKHEAIDHRGDLRRAGYRETMRSVSDALGDTHAAAVRAMTAEERVDPSAPRACRAAWKRLRR